MKYKDLSKTILLAAGLLFASQPAAAAAGNAVPGDIVALASGKRDSYYNYIQKYKNVPQAEESISLSFENAKLHNAQIRDGYQGKAKACLLGGGDFAQIPFTVKNEGLYCIELEYRYENNMGKTAELFYEVDGESPYLESDSVALKSVWKDSEEISGTSWETI